MTHSYASLTKGDTKLVSVNTFVRLKAPVRHINLADIEVTKIPKGQKKVWIAEIWEKDFLAPFLNIRERLEAIHSKHCYRSVLGSWITTRERAAKYLDEVEKERVCFDELLRLSEEEYLNHCRAALNVIMLQAMEQGFSHDDTLKMIADVEKVQPSFDEIQFDFQFVSATAVVNIEAEGYDKEQYQALKNGLTTTRNGLFNEVLNEVVVFSKEILNTTDESDVLHGKTVKRLFELQEKLESFGFVHEHIATIFLAVNSVLERVVNRNRAVSDAEFRNICKMLKVLSDRVTLEWKLTQGIELMDFKFEVPPQASIFDVEFGESKNNEALGHSGSTSTTLSSRITVH